ncbi:MAG: response regulator [Candidatus Pacearchaeota archaeon]|jgi:CheY-like chemotaxis protein
MVFYPDSKNVLVLEDSEGIRFSLEAVIEHLGFVPYFSESREEFIGLYRSIPYFAAILDNQVPYDKNGVPKKDIGISLAPQLLRREPELKVALHTGDDMKEKIPEFEKIGLIYLPKPASIEDIAKFLAAA